MNKRRKRHTPPWAARDRWEDMAWIAENMHIFNPAARQQYKLKGRGAIVVDTKVRMKGAGHPFTYLTLAQIQLTYEMEAQRMVRAYAPEHELVIVLIKPKRRVSVYRCWLL